MRCLGEAHYVFTCISIFMSELFIDYFIWFLHKIFHEKNVRNPFSARFGRQYRSISTKTRLDVALIQSPYSCHIKFWSWLQPRYSVELYYFISSSLFKTFIFQDFSFLFFDYFFEETIHLVSPSPRCIDNVISTVQQHKYINKVSFLLLTLQCIKYQNDQTHFKNLIAFVKRFLKCLNIFGTLSIRGLTL